jgi:hypothetical protein
MIVSLLLVLAVPRLAESSPTSSQSAVPAETKQKLSKLQIPFIANQGQGDKEVKFYARTFGGTVFVTETGELVYSFAKLEDKKRVKGVTLSSILNVLTDFFRVIFVRLVTSLSHHRDGF